MVKVALEAPTMVHLAVESIDAIFNNPTSMFSTLTAMDFIFKGYEIDCSSTTVYAAKVACKELRKHKALRMVDDNKKLLRYRWFDNVRQASCKNCNSISFSIKLPR